jgi:thymidine kinase
MMPELNLIMGPMFAGKSTYLINKVKTLINNGVLFNEILLINHASDKRYDCNKICSHSGEKINAISQDNLSSLVNDIIYNVNNMYSGVKYIFIDEVQFFNDLYISIKTLMLSDIMKNNILQIYICGLDGDYKQEPFKNSGFLELIPYATNIIKLTAKCSKCNSTASFTKRISNSLNNTFDTIFVGGADDYQPTCLLHLQTN